MMTSDLRAEVEIWPFRACAMHPIIIIETVRSLWVGLWGRYHVAQNVYLVQSAFTSRDLILCIKVLTPPPIGFIIIDLNTTM